VTQEQALAAKEARYDEQRRLLGEGGVLTSLNLNLPGGYQNYAFCEELLDAGVQAYCYRLQKRGLRLSLSYARHDHAGPYWLGMVHGAPHLEVKRVAASVEEGHVVGRLWDIDVLDAHAVPISRDAIALAPRKCYLCTRPAHECRLNTRHSVESLQRAVERIWLRQIEAEVCRGALSGMLCEAATWPSPGLVSPFDAGAHRDMRYSTFLLSTASIAPGFAQIASLGVESALCRQQTQRLDTLLWHIRARGIEMERQMEAATSGVNTQRGLIFVMGLGVAAASFCWARNSLMGVPGRVRAREVADAVSRITSGIVQSELVDADQNAANLSPGQRLFLNTGLTGVRGEVSQGFPSVMHKALPALEDALSRVPLEDAFVHCLITLMSCVEDSALCSRHSAQVLKEVVWQMARDALDEGSVFSADGRKKIVEMDEYFSQHMLNPGGCADLLALAIAMYIWQNGEIQTVGYRDKAKWQF